MSHAFCKDIMDWDQFPSYDLLYTDPPWGDRMVKFFETTARKQTGSAPTRSAKEILTHLAKLAITNAPLVIEYEIKGWDAVIAIMEAEGHKCTGKIEAVQSMGRPFVILPFNCEISLPEGIKGAQIVTEVVKQIGAKEVFDPFAGIGFTAKAVHDAGAEYIGSEMNSARFAKLEKIVTKHNER